MLVTAGWQETKKSPASRLAGDLAFFFAHKISAGATSLSLHNLGSFYENAFFRREVKLS